LGQHAVARGLDDAPLVLGDLAVDQLAPMRLEARERALLVGADQPRVTRDIRGKNGGEPTLHDSPVIEQSRPHGRGRGDRPDIIWGLRRGSVCATSGNPIPAGPCRASAIVLPQWAVAAADALL